MRSRLAAAVVLVVTVAPGVLACGGASTEPGTGADTSQSLPPGFVAPPASGACAIDDDCVAVFSGDICDCDCTQAAIAKEDQPAHAARIEEARAQCTDRKVCGPCKQERAVCSGGTCAIAR